MIDKKEIERIKDYILRNDLAIKAGETVLTDANKVYINDLRLLIGYIEDEPLLSLKELEGIPDGDIFAHGKSTDNEDGINMLNTDNQLTWIAVRGGGAYDWAIYVATTNLNWDHDRIKRMGDKVSMERFIRKIIPCTDEAYEAYRR